jgi:hypothetical protein
MAEAKLYYYAPLTFARSQKCAQTRVEAEWNGSCTLSAMSNLTLSFDE